MKLFSFAIQSNFYVTFAYLGKLVRAKHTSMRKKVNIMAYETSTKKTSFIAGFDNAIKSTETKSNPIKLLVGRSIFFVFSPVAPSITPRVSL